MPRIAKQLTDLAVRKLATKPGRHAVGGVNGLYLLVGATGATSWVLRMVTANGRSDLGLGSYGSVGLATARDEARRIHSQARTVDPVEARRAERTARKAAKAQAITFEADARALHKVKAQEFRNPKHAAQWITTLETYGFPLLGDRGVGSIERSHIVAVLEPIWTTKTETATRVRQRIEHVLDYAAAQGHRSSENPARWKGGLDKLLPNPSKLKKRTKKHHPALPWRDVPNFVATLVARKSNATKALHFAILTALP